MCPSAKFKQTPPGGLNAAGQPKVDESVPYITYLPNEVLIPRAKWVEGGYPRPYRAVPLAAVGAPASVIAIAETADVANFSNHRPAHAWLPIEPYKSAVGTPVAHATLAQIMNGGKDGEAGPDTRITYTSVVRHTGGSNYVFGDGHAKWYKISQTVDPNWLWGEEFYSLSQ